MRHLFLASTSERRKDQINRSLWNVGDRTLAAIACVTWAFWLTSIAWRLRKTIISLGLHHEPPIAINEYLGFIDSFWSGTSLYIPNELHGFHYFPIMLVIGTPLSWMNLQISGAIFGLLSAGFFTFSIYRLSQQVSSSHPAAAAGIILAISAKVGVLSIWLLQMQMPMTAAMICAAVAAMTGKARPLVLWLTFAVALKPLSIVMALLAAVTIPRTRLWFVVGLATLLLLPFAFRSWNYLAIEYFNYVQQLAYINDADPGVWHNQAEISTLLNFLGFDFSPHLRLAIRLLAAVGTLLLAWRIVLRGNTRAAGFALLILAVCYIGLFNPRQEDVSFILVVPAVAALGLFFLGHHWADWRGWIWLTLALMLSLKKVDAASAWFLPGVMVLIWFGLLTVMANPSRWSDLLSDEASSALPRRPDRLSPN